MPVHTAYAIPKGSVLTDKPRNQKLNKLVIMVITEGTSLVKLAEYFNPTAHTISNIPAINRYIHAISSSFNDYFLCANFLEIKKAAHSYTTRKNRIQVLSFKT